MSKKSVGIALLAAICVAGFVSSGFAAVEVKIGSAAYLADAAEDFARLLEEKSGGAFKATVLRDRIFEDEVAAVSMAQSGSVQIVTSGINKLGVAPSAGFVSFPYIFPNFESAERFFASDFMSKVNARIRSESAESGGSVFGAGWFLNDYRSLTNSKRRVTVPEDLKGLIIRVPESKVMIDVFNGWGASATPLAWSEVPEALEFGMIDGQENPFSIIVGANLQKTQKFLTTIKYNLWAGTFVVNSAWYDALPDDLRGIFDEAGREAGLNKTAKSKRESAEYRSKLEADGVEISEPEEEAEKWAKPAMKLWKDLYPKSGGEEWIVSVTDEINKK